mmetsp:Transcript_45244/g.120345  ORF Transcript_45244/g.120345 Transcript_45244/m.120345 type:complete len:128 (+) Transcript_45244:334-717(+)
MSILTNLITLKISLFFYLSRSLASDAPPLHLVSADLIIAVSVVPAFLVWIIIARSLTAVSGATTFVTTYECTLPCATAPSGSSHTPFFRPSAASSPPTTAPGSARPGRSSSPSPPPPWWYWAAAVPF